MILEKRSKFPFVILRWLFQKWGLTELLGHDRKLLSDMNLICRYFQSFVDENRESCHLFPLNFQATIKYVVFSVRLIFLKVGVDGFIMPRRESDVRDKFL